MITAPAEGVAGINSALHANLIPHICIVMRRKCERFRSRAKAGGEWKVQILGIWRNLRTFAWRRCDAPVEVGGFGLLCPDASLALLTDQNVAPGGWLQYLKKNPVNLDMKHLFSCINLLDLTSCSLLGHMTLVQYRVLAVGGAVWPVCSMEPAEKGRNV